MKKKLFILVLLAFISLTACTKKESEKESSQGTSPSETIANTTSPSNPEVTIENITEVSTIPLENEFLDKLINSTSIENISWNSLLDLGHAFDEDHFENFEYLLHQDDNHQIHIEKSFHGTGNGISLLFLFETFTSETGSEQELNLYYAKDYASQPLQLKLTKEELDPLYQIVSKKVFSNPDEENFMEDYINN